MQPEIASIAAIGTPKTQDWEVFRRWAAAEGWRVPAREVALYRNALADSAMVLRDGDGAPLGFVTVCRQQAAGWIGNLIVDPTRRGAGFGRKLFQYAVDRLAGAGAGTLWLTASGDGRPLYERFGFREAARVERWVWVSSGTPVHTNPTDGNSDLYALARADADAWGYSRAGLLTHLARDGRIASAGSTVALLQGRAEDLHVLGPWLSADLCPHSNRMVLAGMMETVAAGAEVAVDLLGGSPVRLLLAAVGFRQAGETVLMTRGNLLAVRYGKIVALASLGSMG